MNGSRDPEPEAAEDEPKDDDIESDEPHPGDLVIWLGDDGIPRVQTRPEDDA